MNALVIANTQIRCDATGRYCLNDLHQASGGEPRHRPGRWLDSEKTRELIHEVENDESVAGIPATLPALVTLQGGAVQGTYAVKELVYAYAMWISAKFHLHVIRAYDALVTQRVADDVPPVPASPQHRADVLISASRGFSALVRAGRTMGMDRLRSLRAANTATFRATGIDLIAEMEADDVVAESEDRLTLPGERNDSPRHGVAAFLRAMEQGDLGIGLVPCLSADAFELYALWCRQSGQTALNLPRFVHLLCESLGVRRAAKRYRQGSALIGPARLLLWGYMAPGDIPEPEYLGECVRRFHAAVEGYAQHAAGEGVAASRGFQIRCVIQAWVADRQQATTEEVIESALRGDPQDKELQSRVGIVLRKLGWTQQRKRIRGERLRIWLAPKGA